MGINFITNIGIAIIVLYATIKLLEFYGVEMNSYGVYLAFYLFLFISTFILPKQYPTFE